MVFNLRKHGEHLVGAIPNKLYQQRKKYKLSQQAVANYTSMSASVYAGFENGKFIPTRAALAMLCNYFRCTPDVLYPPYVLVMIGVMEHDEWIKPGGWWEEELTPYWKGTDDDWKFR